MKDGKKWLSFNAVSFCKIAGAGIYSSCIDLGSLNKECSMCAKWQVLRIVFLHMVLILLNIWMWALVKWYIVGGCLNTWDSQPLDFTHVTWGKAIVALHMHEHRDGWNISKDKNQECS